MSPGRIQFGATYHLSARLRLMLYILVLRWLLRGFVPEIFGGHFVANKRTVEFDRKQYPKRQYKPGNYWLSAPLSAWFTKLRRDIRLKASRRLSIIVTTSNTPMLTRA